MNKNEFMRKLKDGLVGLNQTDKREILLDYEEHFLDGLKAKIKPYTLKESTMKKYAGVYEVRTLTYEKSGR